MKIVLTGSLGHISKPLIGLLVGRGDQVTVISSKTERKAAIEALRATAAIGSVEDIAFLTKAFTGADVVYTMVPPPSNYFDPNFDVSAYTATLRNNYFNALSEADIKRVVNLSSWGADKDNGTGGIVTAHYMEERLNQLPDDVAITHVRPASFYYNLYSFIPMIKNRGMIAANYGGDDITVLVAPEDIATVVAKELEAIDRGRKVVYVASDELSCKQVAHILGNEIGMPELKWVLISDEEAKSNLKAAGIPAKMASSLVELQAGHHNRTIGEDYWLNKPAELGKIKIRDFAKEFAKVFNRK